MQNVRSIPTQIVLVRIVLPNNRITNSSYAISFLHHTFICATKSFLTESLSNSDYKQKRDDIVDDMLQSANIHIPKKEYYYFFFFWFTSTKNKKIRSHCTWRFPFACRAANNNNENPFASLQHIRSTLADKPELAVKKKERRSMEIDEFAYEEENKTKKATNAKKAVPTSSPSKNSKGVRIKVERRKNKSGNGCIWFRKSNERTGDETEKGLGCGCIAADVDRRACIFQGTHANALEDMIKAMGYKDVKIVK